ncbi:MAG: hypothetical protein JST48_08220 [Bacteroidetes bacterium]|nr:hypothetical protein [Bacteroidota bacterium]
MKSKLWAELIMVLLVACSNARTDKSFSNSSSRVPNLKGTWLQSDYKKAVLENKSPFKSHSLLHGISCLLVKDFEKDTVRIGVIINNHEGNEIKLIPEGKDRKSFILIDNEAEGYTGKSKLTIETSESDTLLILNYFSSDKVMRKKVYERISPKIIDDPFSYFVNQALFVGHYIVYDSTPKKVIYKEASLNGDGAITGLNDFDFYEVVTDYAVQPEEFDLVKLNRSGLKKHNLFTYEVRGNDIYLYKLISSTSEDELIKGTLQYLFKRTTQ